MKATARGLHGRPRHEVEIGGFRFATSAPTSAQEAEHTPSPQELLAASLAACSALTVEAYAKRKGWDVGEVVVEVDYEIARRGCPARCAMVVRLPEHVPPEQQRRLMSVAATSPMHRTLEGETMFDERLELRPAEATDNRQPNSAPPARSSRLFKRVLPSSLRAA